MAFCSPNSPIFPTPKFPKYIIWCTFTAGNNSVLSQTMTH